MQTYTVEEWDGDAVAWVQIGGTMRDVGSAESLRDAIRAAGGSVLLITHPGK